MRANIGDTISFNTKDDGKRVGTKYSVANTGDSIRYFDNKHAHKNNVAVVGDKISYTLKSGGRYAGFKSGGVTGLLFKCLCCNSDRSTVYTPEYVIGQLKDDSIVISYDYGATWDTVSTPISFGFLDISVTHGNVIYGRGTSGSYTCLAVSYDNGSTWSQIYSSSIIDLSHQYDPYTGYIFSLWDITVGSDGELWALDRQMKYSGYPVINPEEGEYHIWKYESGTWTEYVIDYDWTIAGQAGYCLYNENLVGFRTNSTTNQLPTYNRTTSSAAWVGGTADPVGWDYGVDVLFPRRTRTDNYAWTIAYPLDDWGYRCQRLYKITPAALTSSYVGTYDTFTLYHYRDLTSNMRDTLVNIQNTWATGFTNPITPYKVEYSTDEGTNWNDSGITLPSNAMDRVYWLGQDWYGIIDTTGALTRFQIPS